MIKIRTYVNLWLLITLVLFYESYALNKIPGLSLTGLMKARGVLPQFDLNPDAGKPLSMFFGYTGFGLMLLTNFYVLRKRFSITKNLGFLSGWLNFHIFCGLLGPTFILFHTNFKIGGLVAISFWSMVVSFASGIVGRYFYVQIVGQKVDLQKELTQQEERMKRNLVNTEALKTFEDTKKFAISLAGARSGEEDLRFFAVMVTVARSFIGDLRLRLSKDERLVSLPQAVHLELNRYAVNHRRVLYLESFRTVMGYWHAFHMPFAVFMYVVAVIHIATALLFKV
jgi:hypothetical protein